MATRVIVRRRRVAHPLVRISVLLLGLLLAGGVIGGLIMGYTAVKTSYKTEEKIYPRIVHGVVELSVNDESQVTIIEDMAEEVTIKRQNDYIAGRVLTIVYDANGDIEKVYNTGKKELETVKKTHGASLRMLVEKYIK